MFMIPPPVQQNRDEFGTSYRIYRDGNTVTGTERGGTERKVTVTYLFEGARSGSGETVEWPAAANVARQGNMILAGGLGVQNVAEAIATVRPIGVDVSSGVETAPGEKDAGLIRHFISTAKAAENNL